MRGNYTLQISTGGTSTRRLQVACDRVGVVVGMSLVNGKGRQVWPLVGLFLPINHLFCLADQSRIPAWSTYGPYQFCTCHHRQLHHSASWWWKKSGWAVL